MRKTYKLIRVGENGECNRVNGRPKGVVVVIRKPFVGDFFVKVKR